MWANARHLAWKLAPGSAHAVHTLSAAWGGGGAIPSAKLLRMKEMAALWTTVRQHNDDLRTLAQWE